MPSEAGLEAVYGNFLRGNVSESLYLLGRWTEARELASRALDWLPTGVIFLTAAVQLAMIEIETRGRRTGGSVPRPDDARIRCGPRAATGRLVLPGVSLVRLWRGDVADAARSVERGWAAVRETEEWVLAARMAAMVARVDAAIGAEAREQRRLAPAGHRPEPHGRRRQDGSPPSSAPAERRRRPVRDAIAEAYLATARAFQRRLEGDDDPAIWDRVAASWGDLSAPYDVAMARWRQAEAILTSGGSRPGRADAQPPMLEASRLAMTLAGPTAAARTARAGRPSADHPAGRGRHRYSRNGLPIRRRPGPGRAGRRWIDGAAAERSASCGPSRASPLASARRPDTFGLSAREQEVLVLVAQGRTNREIGERLFISQKTVGVHVGNILVQAGRVGRVEAAAVAIRLGLTGPS